MTYLNLFPAHVVRVLPYDLGSQAFYMDESITSHGLPQGHRDIADFEAGWLKAERKEQYRAQVQSDAVLLAKGC